MSWYRPHPTSAKSFTVLEELWHILLGHKLTKIARVAEAYGRTYDTTEEHDAYYLASATLLPKTTTRQSWPGENAPKVPELIEFGAELCAAWWLFFARMRPENGPSSRCKRAPRKSWRTRWRTGRDSNPR